MIRRLVPLGVVLLCAGFAVGRPDDKEKTDGTVEVPVGTEFKLNKDEVKLDKEADEEGRFPVTVKAAAAPTAVKMPAQKWMLAFTPDDQAKDKVEVAKVVRGGPLEQMRVKAKATGEPGTWLADPGDVITHVNGYAVKTVKELICAVNLAADADDIQLVIKDVATGKQYAFYVSATKR